MTEDTKSRRQQERELDQELDDSFPASDPPSSIVPGSGTEPTPDKYEKLKKSGG